MAHCKVRYTVDGVEYAVPVQLLPIIAGTAWQRFSAERDGSDSFQAAASIGLSLIDAQAMSTLWDVLIPPKYFRRIPGLSNIVAQLDGHARSIEYFIAFLLGHNNPAPPAGMTADSLIRDVHARLEEIASAPGVLLHAFDESVLALRTRYANFMSARSELLAVLVSRCPVTMGTVLDGQSVESFLGCIPITVTHRPEMGVFYLNMPLSLLASRATAAGVDSELSAHIISVRRSLLDGQALRGLPFEVFVARYFALLLTASRLLPADLRRVAFSRRYPDALLLGDGPVNVALSATPADNAPIVVHNCVAQFPDTLALRDKNHNSLTPGLIAGTSVIVNAARAAFVDVLAFTPHWRVWLQCKGYSDTELTWELFCEEYNKLLDSLDRARTVDTVQRDDVFVFVSQGRGKLSNDDIVKFKPTVPCIIVCRGHGFDQLFHSFAECASLSVEGVCLCASNGVRIRAHLQLVTCIVLHMCVPTCHVRCAPAAHQSEMHQRRRPARGVAWTQQGSR